ncbi:MAG: NAD(P)H-hydrate dehydratase [Magnetococcales bacterium]|nr:NAD(P)H-hydrate dehydratase [Magnetococcales bacterium]
MPRLLTSAQMQEADRKTIEELGIPGIVLMENAGAGVVRTLWEKMPDLHRHKVLVLAGRGNNGGDGFVIARRLLMDGVRVSVLLFGQCEQLTGDAKTNCDIYTRLDGLVHEVQSDEDLDIFFERMPSIGLVVDAVFGTGLQRPVEGMIAQVLEHVNDSGVSVMAVDIPSGVSSDDGQVMGTAIQAEWTVTFAAEKIGHRMQPGASWCGEVIQVFIGIPPQYIDDLSHAIGTNFPLDIEVPARAADSHKGHFGHLLIIAGGRGKAGAAILATESALRSGPGLVTTASPKSVQKQIACQLVEAMTYPLPEDDDGLWDDEAVEALAESGITPTALAIGPGLGVTRDGVVSLGEILERHPDLPMVLDADALNILAMEPAMLTGLDDERTAPLAISPHPGEMARLTGLSTEEIQNDRLGVAIGAATEWGVWIVLKGAGTIIAAPDGRAWINDTGNVALASGGSGDLLTGLIGGLLAQGWEMESALRAAVWLHGSAADAIAAENGPIGVMASDLLPLIQKLRNEL